MQVTPYSQEWKEGWDKLVKESKNGTFLINRSFMDYHKDKYHDCSLLFAEGDNILGVLPANWDEPARTVYSHQGLTYGGLILNTSVTAVQVNQMIDEAINWYKENLDAEKLIYKPIPYIYDKYPAQEDLYALFRHDAKIIQRGLSCTVPLRHSLPFRELRKRGKHRAIDNALYLSKSCDIVTFWNLLDEVLSSRHQTHPVHSVDELIMLTERFPKEIQLFVVKKDDDVLAGTLLFITPQVIHVQYIAANDKGCEYGALDLLFHYLINEKFRDMPSLDFGVSTEQGGLILNEGLEFQKEGFGGRGVCYDTYEIPIL